MSLGPLRLLPFAVMVFAPSTLAQAAPLSLDAGWSLQSSAKVPQGGDAVSSPQLDASSWYPVSVPTTVVAGLVKSGVYKDPYFGMNLRSLPGVTYPIGKNFSNIAMDPSSPFAVPWWFRKQFTLPASYKGKTIWLHFGGINYRADIWLNGKQLAKQDEVAGAYRAYDIDITEAAKPGAANVLAVRVSAPGEHDLAITFVDWNPAAPDKGMGLWREVSISTSGPARLRHPMVATELTPANDRADLTVTALVKNASRDPLTATVKARIEKIEVAQEVEIAAGQEKEVVFAPEKYAQLRMAKPKLWWPAQMGEPHLYDLAMRVEVKGKLSDQTSSKFGVRKIKSELNADKKRLFTVNGKKILIRGAGWSSDMMLRYDPQHAEDQLKYVQDMGLNTVRLEGKLEAEHFFETTDRMGLLVMAGWCCCDHWEKWKNWKPVDYQIAEHSLRDQTLRLRAHPSVFVWLNGSDFFPPPDVEKMYLRVQQENRWPNPVVSSATEKPSTITGESGVKMSGPYEYVAPSYWMEDTKNGGAHGFNTETSPGPAIPPIESLRKMFPPDRLWPINETWAYHAGGDVFANLAIYSQALEHRYGKAENVEDFANKSQLVAYEGIRAMFEAYSRNKYTSTGVIQWMLNNAWPSLIWHLYDYFLLPGGGYFGAKKAMEPIHPIYSYDDHSVWVVNSQYVDVKGLKLMVKAYDLDGAEKYSREATLDAAADSTNKVLSIPADAVKGLGPTYFVRLALEEGQGKAVGSNFYWLSNKPEVLDWDKSTWYMTPTKSYADFTALAKMPRVKIAASTKTERHGKDLVTHVTLENPSRAIAFFIRLKVNKGEGGEEILPVLWQDNYVTLMPGEKRQIAATYRASDLGSAKPIVEVSGWNASL